MRYEISVAGLGGCGGISGKEMAGAQGQAGTDTGVAIGIEARSIRWLAASTGTCARATERPDHAVNAGRNLENGE